MTARLAMGERGKGLIAHSRGYGRKRGWGEPDWLVVHSLFVTLAALKIARDCGVPKRLWPSIARAAIVHDLGKAASPWQAPMSRGQRPEEGYRHEVVGGFLWDGIDDIARLGILAHHKGIPSESYNPEATDLLVESIQALEAEAAMEERGEIPVYEEPCYQNVTLYFAWPLLAEACGVEKLFPEFSARMMLFVIKRLTSRGGVLFPQAPENMDAWELGHANARLSFFNDLRVVTGCLVRADHHSTAEWVAKAPRDHLVEDRIPMWALEFYESRVGCWEEALRALKLVRDRGFSSRSDLEKVRREFQTMVAEQMAKKPRGLKSMPGPTSIGKTLAQFIAGIQSIVSTDEAVRPRHLIFASSYVSLLHQALSNIREWQELSSEIDPFSALDIHKEFDPEREGDAVLPDFYSSGWHEWKHFRCAREAWTYPTILTSHVQAVAAATSCFPKEIRRMPTLVDSVLIVDEFGYIPTCSQVMDGNIVEPFTAICGDLAGRYRLSGIFCSASLAKLYADKRRVAKTSRESDFRVSNGTIRPLVPNSICRRLVGAGPQAPKSLKTFKGRHRISFKRDVTIEYIRDRVCKESDALCKVNTRRIADAMYRAIVAERGPDGVYLLSGTKPPKHVFEDIERVRELDKRIAVGTTMVECGLDLDFRSGFCQMGSFDNVLHTKGRVNRRRERDLDRVLLFDLDVRHWVYPQYYADWQRSAAGLLKLMLQEHRGKDLERLFLDPYFFKRHLERLYREVKKGGANPALGPMLTGQYEDVTHNCRIIPWSDAPVLIVCEDSPKGVRELAARIMDDDHSLRGPELAILNANHVGVSARGDQEDRAAYSQRLCDKGVITQTAIPEVFVASDGTFRDLPQTYDRNRGLLMFEE